MKNNPIIVLIDMDCFYVQVELKNAPEYIGKETAVVQYNSWRGGSIIAISYEARKAGINRSMRGNEAKQKCPNLHLFSVPEFRGKADLRKYRSAGAEVIKCLTKHASRIERASIDEAYIDLTDEVDNFLIASPDSSIVQMFWQKSEHSSDGCHIIGYESYDMWLDHIWQIRETNELPDDLRLAFGGFLVQRIRDDIYATLGYRCSAGIGHSKMVAKYACGVYKPNQQTVIPMEKIQDLLFRAPIEKIRNLGGKMGSFVQEQLKVSTMGQLACFSLDELTEKFGEKTGPWLFYLCRGQDDESVLSRQLAQSIGCSKNFPGSKQLNTIDQVQHWLSQMAEEISERVEEDCTTNSRLPTHMCVSYRQLRTLNNKNQHKSISGSRVVQLNGFSSQAISSAAFVVLSGINNASHQDLPAGTWFPPLISLGLSAGKFRTQKTQNDISRYFIDAPIKTLENKNHLASNKDDDIPLEISDSSNIIMDEDVSPIKIKKSLESDIELSIPKISNDLYTSGTTVMKRKGFFARLQEKFIKEVAQVVSYEQGEVDDNKSTLDVIVEKEIISKQINNDFENRSINGKGFDFIDHQEPIEGTEGNDTNSSCLTSFTNDDYFNCEECCKKILMWDVPEHNDWHLAQKLQKQISKEMNQRTAVKVPLTTKKKDLKRKPNNIQSNQLTLDNFFTK